MKDDVRTEQAKRDAHAATYESWYIETKGALFDRRERAVFAAFAPSDPEGRVLDLGCGTGRVAAALKHKARRVIGSDLSVESLRQLVTNVDLPGVAADAAVGLPFRGSSLALVSSCGVLPRLDPPGVERVLAECHRSLIGGGRLVFNVYNHRYWRASRLSTRQARPDQACFFSVTNVTELARAAGFAVESVSHYAAVPFRRVKAQAWLTIDQGACALPLVGPRLGSFTLFALRKR